jgi:hypothetical protein
MNPSDTAQAFFTALDQHDWQLAAACLDPTFAGHLRRKEIARLLGRAKRLKELGLVEHPEGILGYNPAYTPELLATFGGLPVYNLPGATTVAELDAMPDQAFIQAYLSLSSRWRPEFEETPEAIPLREIIGEQAGDAPDQVVVHYHFALPNVVPSRPQPVERLLLQRGREGWRILFEKGPPAQEFIRFLDLANPDTAAPAG